MNLSKEVTKPLDVDREPLPFGKYKGKTPEEVSKIDPSYIVWLCKDIDTWYNYISQDLYNICVDQKHR